MNTPRADHEFLRETKAFARQFEEHLASVGYSARTVHTKTRGVEWFVRWLKGEEIAPGRTGRQSPG